MNAAHYPSPVHNVLLVTYRLVALNNLKDNGETVNFGFQSHLIGKFVQREESFLLKVVSRSRVVSRGERDMGVVWRSRIMVMMAIVWVGLELGVLVVHHFRSTIQSHFRSSDY